MKIAVTSSGDTLDSAVDPRFGRAAKFVVFDTETGESHAVDNSQNVQMAQGAGIQAAGTIARLGVQCLITGHCGPKAFRTLSAAGVEIFVGGEGTVREALDAHKAGKLQSASGPDVRGHW